MPVDYKIFPEFDLYVTRPKGLVGSEELIVAYETIFRDPQCGPGFRELVDLRQVAAFDVSTQCFQQIAAMTEAFQGTAVTRTAVLVDRAMNEIISRLYQSIAETGTTEIVEQFTDLDEALAWLERPAFPPEMLEGRF